MSGAVRKPAEIERLREANQIVAAAHTAIRDLVRPGVTTGELDEAAETAIRELGAEPSFKGYQGTYPCATCISVEEEVVHGIPGNRRLEAGQIVSVDIGTRYRGYYGDAAVTWPVGVVDPERARLLRTTERALAAAIQAAVAGKFVRDIGRAVEKVCREERLGVGHRGRDLELVADDAGVLQQRIVLALGVAGHLLGIETVVRSAVVFPLVQHRAPREAGLHALEDEEFEERGIVVQRRPPLGVVVGGHQIVRPVSGPRAARLARCHGARV